MKRRRNKKRNALVGILFAGLVASALAPAQELVFSTGSQTAGPSPLVVFADLRGHLAGNMPTYVVPTQPDVINPHGFTFLGPTTVAAGKISTNVFPRVGVDIIDTANGSLLASFNPGGANDTAYTGLGTVILNPAGSHVLLAAGSLSSAVDRRKVWVVPTPLSGLSVASAILTLPGDLGTAQTHAVAFDHATGRAYIAHTTGITAIDPPYAAASIAFTIPLPTVSDTVYGSITGRAVELSPDGSTLLTTTGGDTPGTNLVTVIHAPFSGTSAHEDIVVDHAFSLDAVAFTPDGSQALVVDLKANQSLYPQAQLVAPSVPDSSSQAQVFAPSAPYSASSTVEWLKFFPEASPNTGGFEDLEISPDGRIAALAGGCLSEGCPLVILHAPFTATGFGIEVMTTPAMPLPYQLPGRGAGTVHFWPAPITPLTQIAIDRISVTEGNSGTTPATFTVSLSNPSTQTVRVDYATQTYSAQSGSDFVPTSGTLSFAPGQTRRTVTVSVIGDTLAEADEAFRLNLSNPVNARLLNGSAFCLIIDDDSGNPYIVNDSPLPDAYVGVPYAQTFTLANYAGTPSWGVDHSQLYLPSGISMDAVSGVLGGVPAAAGSYYFTVYVLGLIGREYHLTVRDDRIFADGFELLP